MQIGGGFIKKNLLGTIVILPIYQLGQPVAYTRYVIYFVDALKNDKSIRSENAPQSILSFLLLQQ